MLQLLPLFSQKPAKTNEPLRTTAYLDGLRGFAAFIVYISHHIGSSHEFNAPFNIGWGRDDHYSFVTFPFIRILFSGSHFAVCIFFVISGYVLSRGPIKRLHTGEREIGATLSSAVFRRGIRLWLPVILTTFAYMTIRHLGVYASYPVLRDNYITEIFAYFKELWRFTNPLRIAENPFIDLQVSTFSYNPHTWTIALEYQGSMLLFLVLLAFSSLTSKARMGFTATLAIYLSLQGSWVSFCFLSGMLLVEVELLQVPSLSQPTAYTRNCLYLCLIAGLWLAGMPTIELRTQTREYLASNPGWAILSNFIPSTYEDIKPFYLSWAAFLVIAAGSHLKPFQRVFEMSFMQYLGKISFAFYLVHGPVLQVVAMRMYHITGQNHAESGWLVSYNDWLPLPKIGPFCLELPMLAAHLVILPITFALAELVEWTIDERSVQTARWCHSLVSRQDGRVTR